MKKYSFLLLMFGMVHAEMPTSLKIVEPSHPVLSLKAETVQLEEIPSSHIQWIIDEMLEIARGEREDCDKKVMVGLAAPQVGVSKQIILVDLGIDQERKDLGELKAFINPTIVWQSEELVHGREGCYSVDSHLSGIVPRSESIQITAYDRFGNQINERFFGFTARIFQHEIDHLQGYCFPERVGKEGVLHWVNEEEYPEYRKNWQNWPHTCPWDVWESMKKGQPS